jgi:hypothetical protein
MSLQPGDLVTAYVMAGPLGRLPELVGAVNRVVGAPDRHQHAAVSDGLTSISPHSLTPQRTHATISSAGP